MATAVRSALDGARPQPLFRVSICRVVYWAPRAGLGAALLIGIALRLVWVEDMEYKADEVWTFEHARTSDIGRSIPWRGMDSSVGVPNPGMSLWVFIALRGLSGAQDPPRLTRAVQVANCLALILLVAFAVRQVPRAEREAWLWAAALVAVNPLAVLFHRKLWPPCVLPLVTLAALWGWWQRGRRPHAFVWGLAGACLGQIHMAGFFFTGGFALWALLFDRKRTAWGWWLGGSVLGGISLVPWASYMFAHPPAHAGGCHFWMHALELKFWLRWFTESFGLGIYYTLGPHFREFLAGPLVMGRSTYLVAVAHAAMIAAAVFLLTRAGWAWWRDDRAQRMRHSSDSPTAFTLGAALGGFGLMMTLSCCPIHRHYMIVLFPLESLWVAWIALGRPGAKEGPRRSVGRAALAMLWAAQLLISVQFLAYIHQTQRIAAEYGPTYRAQQLDADCRAETGG